MWVIIFIVVVDDRYEVGKVILCIGLQVDVQFYCFDDNLYQVILLFYNEKFLDCVFIDEVQFFIKIQVFEFIEVVDELDILVLVYGFCIDFFGEIFEGSYYLLVWVDKLFEFKIVCYCGCKVNFVVRFDESGNVVISGNQVEIGGNDCYEFMCWKYFKVLVWD